MTRQLAFSMTLYFMPMLQPDALVAAQAVETLSGETLTFRLTKDGRGVVVALQGDPKGAGNILGPAGIPMGQVGQEGMQTTRASL